MSAVDSNIVNSIIQLTNYFGEGFSPPQPKIASLSELWAKHGYMIALMIKCDKTEFTSSDLFYEVLHRRFRHNNGEFAAALDPVKAAAGDSFEICKFYVHFLEHLRRDSCAMVTTVLENLTATKGFDSQPLLEIFVYLDKLYSEDSLDDWWMCLRGEETDILENLSTPRRNAYDAPGFTTPTASARRFRTAASSARSHRSPIADAVDSPTMKFMRCERELRTAKKKMIDTQQSLEDLDAENAKLIAQNRELKLAIDQLKGNVANNRESAENAQRCAEEMSSELEAKREEVEKLLQQLEENRNLVRTKHRHLEEMEAEKDQLTAKVETISRDRDLFMKQLRDLRNSNELDFNVWYQKEKTLSDELRAAVHEKENMHEQVVALDEMKSELFTENERLKEAVQQLEMQASVHKKKADDSHDAIQELKTKHNEAVIRMREEHAERLKMLEETNERLEKELGEERSERKALGDLLNGLNEKALDNDKANHEQTEGFLSARACLEAAKLRIEHLEIEVKNKDIRIEIESKHASDLMETIANQGKIRESWAAQSKEQSAIYERDMNKLKSELEETASELEKYHSTAETKEAENAEHKATIARMEQEIKDLQKKTRDEQEENQVVDFSEAKFFPRFLNAGSLLSDIAAKIPENGEELDRLSSSIAASMPVPKSVAFSIGSDSDATMREKSENSLGYRTDPRQSICSINEEMFDRASNARSSIRSDMTIASNGAFKEPYTPAPTSKERLGVLKSRNEQVAPHLKSAYVTETQDVHSPSGNEENIKSAKKRRQSIVSMKSFKSAIGLGKRAEKEDN